MDIRMLTDFLLMQQQQYRPISGNYRTYYICETEATSLPGGVSTVLVPELSAVPPTAPPCQAIQVETDHIGIAKYNDIADCNFQRLVRPLQTMTEDAHRRQQDRWNKFKGGALQCIDLLVITLKHRQELPQRGLEQG
jgi:hypothetical protein